MMNRRSILRRLNLASLVLWTSLAAIVSVSGLLYPGGVIRNLTMGVVFAAIGAGTHLLQIRPRPRFGPWLLCFSLPAGAILALLASYRVFLERMAVFG
ncbi:MAG: hypothetical protein HWE39_19885 [Oceanospirillaceae bacterium]|nr:hypothetical protein [Oceanospirillaceae bacterium]